jgi:N-acetyl-gamma-glutamylphosphate reductase
MKIFIIGANGYLGSEIYYLLNKNKKASTNVKA